VIEFHHDGVNQTAIDAWVGEEVVLDERSVAGSVSGHPRTTPRIERRAVAMVMRT